LIVTVCDRQSVYSIREDDVNGPDCPAPVMLTVIDVDPPPAHE
jgi:hypothetical protein